ncbi:hypothetical protein TNIN_172671 [Trichonephila inaurata madagascariensis]|uniref:Uncharacterized protein n=1 Tax=Trichonephila inaurata madagascariensis TaxID=2747483 RepID=A0A8X6XWJ2_9ARAC|nr:hypothetical protein TNIN_172671 [Trichonephila inaurata madagascariensis]
MKLLIIAEETCHNTVQGQSPSKLTNLQGVTGWDSERQVDPPSYHSGHPPINVHGILTVVKIFKRKCAMLERCQYSQKDASTLKS